MATDPAMGTDPAIDTEAAMPDEAAITADTTPATPVRPGYLTTAVAAFGLALGGLAGYGLTHHTSQPQIHLRQAGDSTIAFGFLNRITASTSGASEVAIGLRNDSAVSVQIIGAALAGQTAITGPLAPTVDVPPNADATVYIGFPESNGCNEALSSISFPVHPVELVVFAR